MTDILVGYIVPVIHVSACFFLAVVVLLQTGKGADMGAVFGGGSQTLFGSGGAGNLLTKLTTATAIVFMVTSLIMSYGQSRAPSSTLLDRIPADAGAPATPPPPPAPPSPGANAAGGTVEIPTAPAAPADQAPAGGQ
jgi:preprotein translocase subunit SecG